MSFIKFLILWGIVFALYELMLYELELMKERRKNGRKKKRRRK